MKLVVDPHHQANVVPFYVEHRRDDSTFQKHGIGEIVVGKRGVTVDTGLRLSSFFSMSEGFWTGLQMDFDAAKTKSPLGHTLGKIKPMNRRSAKSA